MDRDLANRLSCVVCGIETKRHAGWFLVMENCWLDRVRVFSWHPVLAREGRMRGVCGKQHLKTLVTHWLNNANLQLVAGGHLPGRLRSTSVNAGPTTLPSPWARCWENWRCSASPFHTGSPEARECILNALIGGTETQARGPYAFY
jgi:hypothetical protein